ncbi:hypothetical protein ACOZ32_09090 [Halobacterium sp. MBLA0001]|uniref:hypothetical protein n=1 Tax=Halobacterium sp. MBLA0001 TaxID=3413511 RepID=UPI003C716219
MFEPEDWEKYPRMALFIILTTIIVVLLTFFLSLLVNRLITTTSTMSTAIDVVSLAVNTLLTLTLILIYRDIRESEAGQESSMEKQTQILDTQKDLLEAQFEPIPSVSFSEGDINENKIDITCKNSGTGIVRGLDLEISFFVLESVTLNDGVKVSRGHPIPLSEIEETTESVIRVDNRQGQRVDCRRGMTARITSLQYAGTNDKERSRSEPVIRANEKEKFTAEIQMMEYSGPYAHPGDAMPTSFENAYDFLSDQGYDFVGYKLKYTYKNVLGKGCEEEIIDVKMADLSEDFSFENIYQNSNGMDSPMGRGWW